MSHETQQHQYQVKLGHSEILVRGRDEVEALRCARKQFGAELPRLWDVIYQLSETQFEIRKVA